MASQQSPEPIKTDQSANSPSASISSSAMAARGSASRAHIKIVACRMNFAPRLMPSLYLFIEWQLTSTKALDLQLSSRFGVESVEGGLEHLHQNQFPQDPLER